MREINEILCVDLEQLLEMPADVLARSTMQSLVDHDRHVFSNGFLLNLKFAFDFWSWRGKFFR